MGKIKITIDQIGETAWIWEVRSRSQARVYACSGSDGEFGCFASMDSAYNDAKRWLALATTKELV